MEKSIDYVKLVEQAQLGDKECLNRLAEAVRERLYAYVYRYTLADDLAHDIVQESILKMLEAIGELREAKQFWPWLNKIALNKIRLYHRNKQHHKTTSEPDMDRSQKHKDSQEAIAGMVYQEFKETVFAAMAELKPEHRSIINMRCYDQMQYSEIAEVLGRSEFAAQKLFFRAKKSLKKKLIRHGLGRGSLLMALVLFGKLTAPSKAAAAGISVTSATVKVGAAASLAAIATSKTAVISLTTAGALTAGTIMATVEPGAAVDKMVQKLKETSNSYVMPQKVQAKIDNQEFWYYYPSESAATVMMRVKASQTQGQNPYCLFLQNAEANYYFDCQNNSVNINNYRQWQKDLSVWRLPTDSFELTEFLAQIDGKMRPTKDVYRSQGGMLLVVKETGLEKSEPLQITHHYNILGEDYFKYDWPVDVRAVDNRDVMHRRGWTYFNITGRIDGKDIKGTGRIPFVHIFSKYSWPWMKLNIGGEIFVDEDFAGFARPWAGLHTIDTVRRDAAEKQIAFETILQDGDRKAQVILTKKSGKVIYTIDMEKDIVEQIEFTGQRQGRLSFHYLQEIDNAGNEFAEPRTTTKDFSILDF